jgi:hypothetical protein
MSADAKKTMGIKEAISGEKKPTQIIFNRKMRRFRLNMPHVNNDKKHRDERTAAKSKVIK